MDHEITRTMRRL